MAGLEINNILDGARIQDIAGKLAGVSMRNTVKVLTALQVVHDALKVDLNEITRLPLGNAKPAPGQAAACEMTHAICIEEAEALCPERLAQLRNMREYGK